MTLVILIIVIISLLAVPLSLKRLIDQSKNQKSDVLPGFDLSAEMEHRTILESRGGYGIEVDEAIPEGVQKIIIALHGLCGSKASRAITLLQQIEMGKSTGLVKFDWPAHGRSRAKDSDLTIENCLSDLDTVIGYVRRKYPEKAMVAFATSFGGYVTMLYHADHPDVFEKIVLRSPALRFGQLLRESIMDDDMRRELEEKGSVEIGFDRKIQVSEDLIHEADRYRIEDIYEDPQKWDMSSVTMIHGDSDELVPYEDSEGFASLHGIELYRVEGADHRYTGSGQLEDAIAFAVSVINDQTNTVYI